MTTITGVGATIDGMMTTGGATSTIGEETNTDVVTIISGDSTTEQQAARWPEPAK